MRKQRWRQFPTLNVDLCCRIRALLTVLALSPWLLSVGVAGAGQNAGLASPAAREDRPATREEWLAGGPPPDWRVGRVAGLPRVLVIEFPDLEAQGQAMNRVAALLEKAGAPRDTVLDDAALQALIRRSGDLPATFYQGHDYRANGLQRFFRLAERQGVALNPVERRLRDLLVRWKLLSRDTRRASAQALVTFTAPDARSGAGVGVEIDAQRRTAVFEHELSHGRYFTDPAYRARCAAFWRQRMSARQRAGVTAMLKGTGYDPRDADLILNEAQAFLFHTPDPRAFDGSEAGLAPGELADLRAAFARLDRAGCIPGNPPRATDCR